MSRFAPTVPALVFLAALVLAGCQTPCPAQTAGRAQADLICEDGSEIIVTFSRAPDFARVVQEGYAPIDLTSRSTGAGYRYVDNGAELRGRGREARWTRPGAAETLCRETQ